MRWKWVAVSSAQQECDRDTVGPAVVSSRFLLPQGHSHTNAKMEMGTLEPVHYQL